jgi:hypothetical protein
MSVRTSLATRRGAQIFGPPRTPVLQAAVTVHSLKAGEFWHLHSLVIGMYHTSVTAGRRTREKLRSIPRNAREHTSAKLIGSASCSAALTS